MAFMVTVEKSTHEFKALPLQIKLADNEGIPKRVQLLRAGVYHDPRYGEFPVTKDMLFSMVKNFDENVLKIDIAIDYGHKSDEEAAAWIKKLSLEKDGTELWADVEWTDSGQKTLAGKRYRYLSADFTDDYIDNQTLKHFGPTLRGAGLTNRPVVKGMTPAIQLQEGKGDMKKPEELEAENKLLSEQIKKLSDDMEAMKKKMPAEGEDKDPKGDDQMAEMKKKLDEVMSDNGKMKKQLEEYAEKFGKLDAEKKASEKKGTFDKMLSEGRVVEAQREAFMSGDAVKFAELAQPVNLNARGSAGEPHVIATADDATKQVREKAQKLLADKKVNTLADAYSKVLAENPELRNKIYG